MLSFSLYLIVTKEYTPLPSPGKGRACPCLSCSLMVPPPLVVLGPLVCSVVFFGSCFPNNKKHYPPPLSLRSFPRFLSLSLFCSSLHHSCAHKNNTNATTIHTPTLLSSPIPSLPLLPSPFFCVVSTTEERKKTNHVHHTTTHLDPPPTNKPTHTHTLRDGIAPRNENKNVERIVQTHTHVPRHRSLQQS